MCLSAQWEIWKSYVHDLLFEESKVLSDLFSMIVQGKLSKIWRGRRWSFRIFRVWDFAFKKFRTFPGFSRRYKFLYKIYGLLVSAGMRFWLLVFKTTYHLDYGLTPTLNWYKYRKRSNNPPGAGIYWFSGPLEGRGVGGLIKERSLLHKKI